MKLLRPGLYRRWNGGCYTKPVLSSTPPSSSLLSSSSTSSYSSSSFLSSPLSVVKIGDRMVVAVKHTAIMYERYCHRMSIRYDDEEVRTMGQGDGTYRITTITATTTIMMIKGMEVIRQGMVIRITASASNSSRNCSETIS